MERWRERSRTKGWRGLHTFETTDSLHTGTTRTCRTDVCNLVVLKKNYCSVVGKLIVRDLVWIIIRKVTTKSVAGQN